MIKSKQDLERYLEQDRRALFVGQRKHPKLFGDEIWKYQSPELLRSAQTQKSRNASGIFHSAQCIRTGAFHRALRYDRRQ